jgi:hypothetical protein
MHGVPVHVHGMGGSMSIALTLNTALAHVREALAAYDANRGRNCRAELAIAERALAEAAAEYTPVQPVKLRESSAHFRAVALELAKAHSAECEAVRLPGASCTCGGAR